MSELHKTLLTTFRDNIKSKFELLKSRRNFMCVYFTLSNTPFITFSNANDFPDPLPVAKRAHTKGFVFACNQDFDTQVTDYLI